jgi:hypothetical protein
MSSQEAFDLEFLLSDARGFVPMDFGEVNTAIIKANARDSFSFSPTASAIQFAKPDNFVDR